MPIISKKVCLIGDFGVGKTSLIRQYIDRQFSDQYLSTIGVKISQKNIDLTKLNCPEQKLQLLIWDIEGQTKFQDISRNYLEGAQGAIIVADLNRQDTIDHIPAHIKLMTSVNPKGLILMVAINKIDLAEETNLEGSQLFNFSQSYSQVDTTNALSSQTGKNSDEIHETLVFSQEFNQNPILSSNPTQNYPQVYTTSAKTGKGVDQLFETLAHLLLEKHV
jgi:small GTP-binding protein